MERDDLIEVTVLKRDRPRTVHVRKEGTFHGNVSIRDDESKFGHRIERLPFKWSTRAHWTKVQSKIRTQAQFEDIDDEEDDSDLPWIQRKVNRFTKAIFDKTEAFVERR